MRIFNQNNFNIVKQKSNTKTNVKTNAKDRFIYNKEDNNRWRIGNIVL